MRNLKVAQKLILGFCLVAFMCAMVGIAGIAGLKQVNDGSTLLYTQQTAPLSDIAKILEYSQRLRIQMRNSIIYTGNMEHLKTVESEMKDRETKFESYLNAYDQTIADPNARKAFDEARQLYNTIYKPSMNSILEGAKAGADQESLIAIMESATTATNTMVDNFTTCMSIKVAAGEEANAACDATYATMMVIIVAVIVIAMVVAIFLAFYISGMISKPLKIMSDFLTRFGSEGDLTMTEEDKKNVEDRNMDEIGQCVESLSRVISRLIEISDNLGKVSNGDLTDSLKLLSEKDGMGLAITKMVDNLNNMFAEIRTASNQVSAGAGQVSQAAQGLASGSSEQAASIEEFTATLTEMQEKTNDNASNMTRAQDVNNKTGERLEDSIRSMGEMLVAMKAIDESSSSITRVIKVIDDIAFQTNILALNAAVEAARAGQHGKGFAVVADEVRNLASKSAAAAKETAELIEGSSERVKEGNQIVAKTNADLEAATENARESTRLIEQVATASSEQVRSIVEINQGIEQISTVVQANSATAEESAAAAQEMAAQAVVLNDIVSKFKLRQSGGLGDRFSASAGASDYSAAKPSGQAVSSGFALSGGKY